MRTSDGGGEIGAIPQRIINTADVVLPEGFKIEMIADGLTFPTGITFDHKGDAFVIEAGYSYGEVFTKPRLLKLDQKGGVSEIYVDERNNGPWNGISFHNGNFYISEGGQLQGGKILKVSPEGKVSMLIENLPSVGDHHTNGLLIHNNYIYFGQGTATNSAVVGNDNAMFGWLKRKPDFHDIPCRDVVLTGKNYETDNALTETAADKALTGAFSPYNTSTTPGQIIKGRLPCTGAVMRIPLNGGASELVAWGLRNPYGIALSPDGKIYVTENSYDDRGSRPVWGSGDVLWELQEDIWYGWPDYSAGKYLVNDEEFKAPGKGEVEPVMKDYPNIPPKPAAIFGVHSSSNGLDFSRSTAFGYKGEAFVAQFGDMAPGVGKVLSPVGFKIVRVNVQNGVIEDFAVNKGKKNAPASYLETGGLERPVALRFDPEGKALYIVDFGIMKLTDKGPQPQRNTGVIWKITKE